MVLIIRAIKLKSGGIINKQVFYLCNANIYLPPRPPCIAPEDTTLEPAFASLKDRPGSFVSYGQLKNRTEEE